MGLIGAGLGVIGTVLVEITIEKISGHYFEKKSLEKESRNAKEKAVELTIANSQNPDSSKFIIEAIDNSVKKNNRTVIADELKKILLVSETPDIERLVDICQRSLIYWRGINGDLPEISRQEIEQTLSELIKNLRSSLIDQPTYKKLFIATEQLKNSEKQLDAQNEANKLLEELVSNTKQHEPKRLDFYTYISSPVHYVKRENFLTDLVKKIISDNNEPIVLHGMSGVGKSTIARAICDIPDIQSFYDGILMIQLGQMPSVIRIFKDLIEHLGGNYASDSILNLKEEFSQCINEKNILLIIDDVWAFSDVENFNVIKGRSKLFITTQKATIAEKLGVENVPCTGMEPHEGLDLFNQWLGTRRNEDSEKIKNKILQKLGYHPLAIKLAGANLAKNLHLSCENWLKQFNIKKLQLQSVENKYDSLKWALGISLDSLTPLARSLYKEISIFPENKLIPSQVILGLWQYDAQIEAIINSNNVLDELTEMALVDVTDNQKIRIHILLLAYLKDEVNTEELKLINKKLIGYYRQLQQESGWESVPPDDYYYDFLPYHLIEAEMTSDLYSLLLDSPAWWHKKLDYSEGSSYIDDIEIAISTFSEPITTNNLIILFQLYAARHAVQESVRSYLDEELQIMVWKGEQEKALRLARLNSEPHKRFISILAIQETLKDMNLQIMKHNLLIDIIDDIKIIEEKISAYIKVIDFYSHVLEDEEIIEIYDIAIRIAKSDMTNNRKVENLIQIILSLLKFGRKDSAKLLAREIYSNHDVITEVRSSLIADLLDVSTELEFPDNIIKNLLNYIIIKLPDAHEDALSRIAASVIKAGFLQEGINIINEIKGNYWKIVAFAHTAYLYHKIGKEEDADKFFGYASQLLQLEYNVPQFGAESAIYRLVSYLAKSRRFYQATNLAYNLRYAHWRGLAFGVLIENLVDSKLIVDARQCYINLGNISIEKRISLKLQLQAMKKGFVDFASYMLNNPTPDIWFDEDKHDLANKIQSVISILIDEDKVDDALTLALKIKNGQRRARILVYIAFNYLSNNDTEKARQICNQAESIEGNSNDVLYIETLSGLMSLRYYLKDFNRASELCKKALDLALSLENCYALKSIFRFAYTTKDTDNDLWSQVSKHIDSNCKDIILFELAEVLDIEKDTQLINQILTHVTNDDHFMVMGLERLAERAIENNDNHLLNKILSRFEYYSNLHEKHTSYIEGFARILAKIGDIDKALSISEKISDSDIVSRASIQVQIASIMFKNNLEDEARQVFTNASRMISNIETFGSWDYPLSNWTASLLGKGHYLEALRLYQPSRGLDYMEVLKDWEEELSVINIELKKTLFLKFVHIYSWVDTEWLTVAQYLKDIDYS